MFVQLEEFGCMCTILSRVKIIESVGFLIQKHETDESTKYVLFVNLSSIHLHHLEISNVASYR